jgi:hypothetical protein
MYTLQTPSDNSMRKKQLSALSFSSACLPCSIIIAWAALHFVSLVVPTSHNLAVSGSQTLILEGPIRNSAFSIQHSPKVFSPEYLTKDKSALHILCLSLKKLGDIQAAAQERRM